MQRVIVFIIISFAVLFIVRRIWKIFTSQTTGHCGGSCSSCNNDGESLPNVHACNKKTNH
ncbi:FeoB-associated Cys-rich membrane protein [Desulfogranum marinum]|uniref:FeoB-associated Cys-rich membrane protein n=1 Tax=Desulfogranum marinum TaxID=453220 RepID=UPI0019645514|nr:FeoB-associated Cys-rich membrane protein [Desulfogranum marinum]